MTDCPLNTTDTLSEVPFITEYSKSLNPISTAAQIQWMFLLFECFVFIRINLINKVHINLHHFICADKRYSLSSSVMVRNALDCAILTPSSALEMLSMNSSGPSTVVSLTILRGRQTFIFDDSKTVLSMDGAVVIPE